MKEIKLYYDQERKNEIKDEIVFEKIMSGEITKKTIFLYNAIQYFVSVDIEISGEDISLKKSIERIDPRSMEKIEFEFKPKVTRMKPLKAKLKIKVEYIIV